VLAEIETAATPRFSARCGKAVEAAILFHTVAADPEPDLVLRRSMLVPAGMVWVCWPKTAAKAGTDITEHTVRRLELPMGFVEIRVRGQRGLVRPETGDPQPIAVKRPYGVRP